MEAASGLGAPARPFTELRGRSEWPGCQGRSAARKRPRVRHKTGAMQCGGRQRALEQRRGLLGLCPKPRLGPHDRGNARAANRTQCQVKGHAAARAAARRPPSHRKRYARAQAHPIASARASARTGCIVNTFRPRPSWNSPPAGFRNFTTRRELVAALLLRGGAISVHSSPRSRITTSDNDNGT